MKTTGSENLEDCIDGSRVVLYHFDGEWTQDGIRALSSFGPLDYFADFPRPFFRVRCVNGMVLQGVQGDRYCRVIFPSRNMAGIRREFEEGFCS